MASVYVWVRLIVGAVFMIHALVWWLQGQRRRFIAWRWFSLMYVAISLCAWCSAGEELTHPYAFALWSALQLAALLLAVCALAVAAVYAVREQQRGPRIRSHRS